MVLITNIQEWPWITSIPTLLWGLTQMKPPFLTNVVENSPSSNGFSVRYPLGSEESQVSTFDEVGRQK
ncbi:hypothetical protein RRG08_061299 [Elysia crispata]|uniref:Uncharacterized protein n=1 Tax=Elysia crispata TaxID=231223 RepID=A0AAE1CXF6_9GAST|nr:hypothetical protein RRG08_061299 [Elysia crispata]